MGIDGLPSVLQGYDSPPDKNKSQERRRNQSAARDSTCIDCSFVNKPPPFTLGRIGADRDRTGNLLVANQALSQLSYGPAL